MIKGYFLGEKVISNDEESFALCEKSVFGEKKLGKVEYASFEALYLIEQKKMEVFNGSKLMSFHDLIKKFLRFDKRVVLKFEVYKDLRNKGYIVKTALKYGADFRVYDKGSRPGKKHSLWILYCSNESKSLTWQEFASKNRIAHSTKKTLLLGILDEEGDISYYEIKWFRA